MVLTASETIEIENLKHAHELQILNRKEEISKAEHEREMERMVIQREIAVISAKSDPELINVLTEIKDSINHIEKYGLKAVVERMLVANE